MYLQVRKVLGTGGRLSVRNTYGSTFNLRRSTWCSVSSMFCRFGAKASLSWGTWFCDAWCSALNETLRGGTGLLGFWVALGPPSDVFGCCDTAGSSLKHGREVILRKPSGWRSEIH